MILGITLCQPLFFFRISIDLDYFREIQVADLEIGDQPVLVSKACPFTLPRLVVTNKMFVCVSFYWLPKAQSPLLGRRLIYILRSGKSHSVWVRCGHLSFLCFSWDLFQWHLCAKCRMLTWGADGRFPF